MKKYIMILLLVAANSIVAELGYYDSFTPLMRAIIQSKESPLNIGRMIAEGADVNAVDVEYLRHVNPVLRYALSRGTDRESVEIIKMLIDAGANVNAATYNRVVDKRTYGFMPLLTYAAIYSSVEVVQMFIDAGAQDRVLGSKDQLCFEKTALEIAQELGNADIVKVLEKAKSAA